MQPRTLYALIAAGLMTMTGAVVADSSATDAQKASAPSFAMKLSPAEAWLKPGETATFSVVAETRAEQTLALSTRAHEGIRVALSSETLDVFPGSHARAALTVAAPENATRSPIYVVVIATAEDGTTREAKAIVHLRDVGKPATERPAQKERPAMDESMERRLSALVERLHRIEKRLDALDAARPARPEPKPDVDHGARMTLSPEHATIGAEGGKVALLLAGGDRDARIPLAVRYNESAGWRVALEQDVVKLRAGERAWVWVHLTPSPDALPLEYAIVQTASPSAYVVNGTATARMA